MYIDMPKGVYSSYQYSLYVLKKNPSQGLLDTGNFKGVIISIENKITVDSVVITILYGGVCGRIFHIFLEISRDELKLRDN